MTGSFWKGYDLGVDLFVWLKRSHLNLAWHGKVIWSEEFEIVVKNVWIQFSIRNFKHASPLGRSRTFGYITCFGFIFSFAQGIKGKGRYENFPNASTKVVSPQMAAIRPKVYKKNCSICLILFSSHPPELLTRWHPESFSQYKHNRSKHTHGMFPWEDRLSN